MEGTWEKQSHKICYWAYHGGTLKTITKKLQSNTASFTRTQGNIPSWFLANIYICLPFMKSCAIVTNHNSFLVSAERKVRAEYTSNQYTGHSSSDS